MNATDRGFRVALLGHGEMGHAIQTLLGERHRVTPWEGLPADGSEPPDVRGLVAQSDFVIFCVPVNPHFELARRILPALAPHCICLSIAKGLDEDGRSPAQVFEAVFGDQHPYAVLYGPMIAEELITGRYGFAQVGTPDQAVYARVRRLFGGSALRVQHSADIAGISWAVILKNVYVPLIGAADELGLGDNARGCLTVAALAELTAIVTRMGGHAETAYELAGLGDLVTTATSAGSHHRALGRALARGETTGLTGEGVHTLAMIRRHALLDPAEYPLLQLMEEILAEPERTGERLRDFLAGRA